MKKGLQILSKEALENGRKMSAEDILTFQEHFKSLIHESQKSHKSKLISIKVPEDLLQAFKLKAKAAGTPYQTQIKKLMLEWLKK